jgi:hypothetical protein
MRRTAAGLTLVLALTLAGCTGGETPADPPAAAAEVAAEGKLGIAEAAERFTQVTEPYEQVMASYHAAYDGKEPLEMQLGLAASTAAALSARVDGLRGTTWPDEVAADIEKIAAADEKAVAQWQAAAAATTAQEAYDAAGRAMALNTVPELDTVRSALGITAAG